jgi:hypothetical protein
VRFLWHELLELESRGSLSSITSSRRELLSWYLTCLKLVMPVHFVWGLSDWINRASQRHESFRRLEELVQGKKTGSRSAWFRGLPIEAL